jgi:glycerol-3-phosphate dehydrogenase
MPHDPSMRPAWLIRLGVFLYDHLARRDVLPGSRAIDLRTHVAGAPLKANYTQGFEYSDGWVDDARLVVLNAIDARTKGATIFTRCECVAAVRGERGWTVTLQRGDGAQATVAARALVNAAGPWAESFLRGAARPAHGETLATRSLRLVKGSHIVVPRLFEHPNAYIFQNPDKRIIFAIPYEDDFTLIGTTDVEIEGMPESAHIDGDEVSYLCAQASRYFARAVNPPDVVWNYCGVRPLLDDQSGDASAVTRDYQLESNTAAAPLLSVWGGKITTFRKLAEEAGDMIVAMLGESRRSWSRGAYLPGGDLSNWIGKPTRPDLDFIRFVAELRKRHPWLAPATVQRMARAYGGRIDLVLGAARSASDLGREIAPGLFEAELDYLRREEWALSADDVLWRRSKLGLHYTREQRAAVANAFMTAQPRVLHAAS